MADNIWGSTPVSAGRRRGGCEERQSGRRQSKSVHQDPQTDVGFAPLPGGLILRHVGPGRLCASAQALLKHFDQPGFQDRRQLGRSPAPAPVSTCAKPLGKRGFVPRTYEYTEK